MSNITRRDALKAFAAVKVSTVPNAAASASAAGPGGPGMIAGGLGGKLAIA